MYDVTVKLNQTGLGVRDAFDFWLSQHDISVPEMFQQSIKAAVEAWLDNHSNEIIEAIASRARGYHEGDEGAAKNHTSTRLHLPPLP
jgi:hypothetical protein